MEILKVRSHKNGCKVLTIPKKSKISSGDYIVVRKLNLKKENEKQEANEDEKK